LDQKGRPPYRVLICGAVIEGWTQASRRAKWEVVLPALVEMHRRWKNLGATLIATLDDRIMVKGAPGGRKWNWYEMYEVPDLETLGRMTAMLESPADESAVNLYKYVRLEAIIGPPARLFEEAVGSLLVEEGAEPVDYGF
jgi:hypothetical protein